MSSVQFCINCNREFSLSETLVKCTCNGLLAIKQKNPKVGPKDFDKRRNTEGALSSGVWRFKEGLLQNPDFELKIVSHPEGNTNLYQSSKICSFANLDSLMIKHEGQNPTGSFKDRGMTVAVSIAKSLNKNLLGCASTGNTSAALASYASLANLKSIVFIPDGKISKAKLSQAIAFGATCCVVKGDFDVAMKKVQEAVERKGLYLVNSLNPYRIEGQKTIVWEMFQQLCWKAPDWIVVPGGNLGNTSAFGKAISEAYEWGWVSKKPKIATIQAKGANPFYTAFINQFDSFSSVEAQTLATAIQIGNPVNYEKAKDVICDTKGIVEEVSEKEIIAAKKIIDSSGIGCEPASACSVAGVKKLRLNQSIKDGETVVAILTGHLLKDSETTLEHTSLESAVKSFEELFEA